jgi:hypothetical protein
MIGFREEEYQRLLLGKLKRQVDDVEAINRRILEAQLKGEVEQPVASPSMKPQRVDLRSEVVDPNFDFEAEPIKPDFDDI